MATKKKEDSKKKGSEKVKDEAKEAKRKARMEALKIVLQNNVPTVNRLMLLKSMKNPKFAIMVMQ